MEYIILSTTIIKRYERITRLPIVGRSKKVLFFWRRNANRENRKQADSGVEQLALRRKEVTRM